MVAQYLLYSCYFDIKNVRFFSDLFGTKFLILRLSILLFNAFPLRKFYVFKFFFTHTYVSTDGSKNTADFQLRGHVDRSENAGRPHVGHLHGRYGRRGERAQP